MTINLGLAGIGHVALKVADIERALEFYRDRLGFAEMMRLNREDGSLWLVYLRITDTQFIELFPGGRGIGHPARTHGDQSFLLGEP
jgi:lactoylglutathione lyase